MHGSRDPSDAEEQPALANVTTRYASAADLEAIYGSKPSVTIQAIVACLDGTPFAVVGLARIDGQLTLFSDYKPGFKRHLRHPAVIRAILQVKQTMVRRGAPVVALADKNEPDSDRLMRRLGFEPVGECEDGGLYKWHG
jgi:hypothetical protein